MSTGVLVHIRKPDWEEWNFQCMLRDSVSSFNSPCRLFAEHSFGDLSSKCNTARNVRARITNQISVAGDLCRTATRHGTYPTQGAL